MTNTADPNKYKYFARFDWPRVEPPVETFPETDENRAAVAAASKAAVAAVEKAFADNPHDIAAVIIEPIQAEGGDRHIPASFLGELRRLCDEHDAMLVLDEVQTGGGLTGTFWCYEQMDVKPDMVAFGKKLQVCGFLANGRIDEVADNVFKVPSRINSTWGADVTDMVRSQRYLEIIREEALLENAGKLGKVLLAGLREIAARHDAARNPRGRGLFCAIDFDTPARRDAVVKALFERKIIALGCGDRTIRTRPFLDVKDDEVARFLLALDEAVGAAS